MSRGGAPGVGQRGPLRRAGRALTGGRRVVVWRHGQTPWNVERRFQGSTDIPLDETGVSQAARAARLLAAMSPARIVSSPLQRAASTAAALAAVTGLEVAYDDRLVERYGGQWEGLTNAEIWDRYPDDAVLWQPADGETEDDVATRVDAALVDALATTPAGETLVVVSHGAALRCGIARLLGLPQDLWWRLGPLGNCSWSLLGEARGDGRGWRLLEHNAGTLPEPVMSDDR